MSLGMGEWASEQMSEHRGAERVAPTSGFLVFLDHSVVVDQFNFRLTREISRLPTIFFTSAESERQGQLFSVACWSRGHGTREILRENAKGWPCENVQSPLRSCPELNSHVQRKKKKLKEKRITVDDKNSSLLAWISIWDSLCSLQTACAVHNYNAWMYFRSVTRERTAKRCLIWMDVGQAIKKASIHVIPIPHAWRLYAFFCDSVLFTVSFATRPSPCVSSTFCFSTAKFQAAAFSSLRRVWHGQRGLQTERRDVR